MQPVQPPGGGLQFWAEKSYKGNFSMDLYALGSPRVKHGALRAALATYLGSYSTCFSLKVSCLLA